MYTIHKCRDSIQNINSSHYVRKILTKTLDPCKRTVALNDTMWIVMTSWNDKKGLHRALKNVESQLPSFKNVHVVVYEDVSPDMMSQEEKSHYSATFLQRLTVQNMGSAYAKFRIFKHIQTISNPNDYVMVLDGDDVLSHNGVLQYIRNVTLQHQYWFMWGRIRGKYEEQCGPLPVKTSMIRAHARNMKRQIWPVCHPRIFKSGLIRYLNEDQFKDENDNWLQKSTDRPFMFSFLEWSGDDRIHFLSEQQIYNYSWTPNNGLLRFNAKTINYDRDYVNQREPMTEHPIFIDVIACLWDRRSESSFFSSIMGSSLRENHIIRLHICNNKPELQYERENIAKMYKQVTVYNMHKNTFGYGRFLLAKKIMKKLLVEYIIMIDDDMELKEHTLQAVFDERKPLTYSAWYGKNWHEHETDYWHPLHQIPVSHPSLALQKFPNVHTWQYGGTGMSIIDARIFFTDIIFACPDEFKNIEDIWLSYVVQLLKWDTLRLRVDFNVNVKQNSVGQWSNLREQKNKMFKYVGYLKCK